MRQESSEFLCVVLLWIVGCFAFGALPVNAGVRAEAAQVQQQAKESKDWIQPLQERVNRLQRLRLATIVLSAVATLLAGVQALKAAKRTKIANGVAIANLVAVGVVAILSSVRSEYYQAEKDSAEVIQAELAGYREDVENTFAVYKDTQDQRDRATEIAESDKAEWQKQIADWDNDIKEKITQLDGLQVTGRNLIKRARTLLKIAEPPKSNSLNGAFRVSGIAYAQSQGPVWVQSLPEDPLYLQERGEGLCSQSYASREYSRYEGRRRLALRMESSASVSGARLNALINAIDSSVQDRQQYSSKDGPNFHTDVWVRLLRESADALLKKTPAAPPQLPMRWSATGAISPAGSKTVITAAAPKKAGTFTFTFEIVPPNKAVQQRAPQTTIRLESIAVQEDGGPGSTRWMFEIFADNSPLLSFPMHRLDDGGKPTTCWPDSRKEGLTATLPSGARQIRILGYRGQDM